MEFINKYMFVYTFKKGLEINVIIINVIEL